MIRMMKHPVIILLTCLLFSCCHCGSLPSGQQAEQTLINSLLSGYNTYIRPDEQVSVDITASLQQIVAIDEKLQIMTSSAFISQGWTDQRLSWTPNSTNNFTTVVMLPVTKIWIPDTMILNSADTSGYFTVNTYSLASVSYDGSVYMILPALSVKTRCALNVKKFPFDRQLCTINFTSWSQGANRLVYTEQADLVIDTSEYSQHPLWYLNGTDLVVIHAGDRVPFEDSYNDVICILLYLQRKPLYFMMNGIFACLILNCVTLLSYTLPFGSQIGLCMTCFMTYSVYSLNFSNLFPQQSQYLMTITLYFLLSIVWTLLSMVWFVICNHYLSRGEMPKPLYAFCGLLERGFVCCFARPPPPNDSKKAEAAAKDAPIPNGDQSALVTKDEKVRCVSCRNCFASCCRRSPKVQNAPPKESSTVVEVEPTTANPPEVIPDEKCVPIVVNEPVVEAKPKCNFCDRCEPCLADYTKDKAKGKGKKDVESKCSALNYFVFLCILVFMFIANMAVWFSMAN